MTNFCIVSGSHGELVVHRASGHIVNRLRDGDGYDKIVWFDPAHLPEDSADILCTAPVYEDGSYADHMEPAAVTYSDGETWFHYEPVLLLPAPTVSIILHGWVWARYWDAQVGDEVVYQEHAEDAEPDGWCVYTRHEGPADWRDPSDFDLSNEQDFDTYDAAVQEAEARAAAYGVTHFED